MAKESMKLEEGFSATKVTSPPVVKPRHYIIGWMAVVAILGIAGYGVYGLWNSKPAASMQERPGLTEILGHKMSGVLWIDVLRAAVNIPKIDLTPWKYPVWNQYGIRWERNIGPLPNTIVNEGENVLEDCFENNTGSACTNVANFEFHGIGTSSQAIAETDGGCITELTTQYNPDNTRATGSQTNNGANVYRTVGTNTVDAGATIEEFCLMDVNTGAANMWTRILTGTITLSASDGLQTTYDLTIE